MLDEWDEDNQLAPLEPVVERAGPTSTSFAHSTFGSRLGGAASGIVHWMMKMKMTLRFRGDGLVNELKSDLDSKGKAGLQEVNCVSLYLVL